jgi:hypothetical protein
VFETTPVFILVASIEPARSELRIPPVRVSLLYGIPAAAVMSAFVTRDEVIAPPEPECSKPVERLERTGAEVNVFTPAND